MKKIFPGIFSAMFVLGSLFFWYANFLQKKQEINIDSKRNLQEIETVQSEMGVQQIAEIETETKSDAMAPSIQSEQIKVPFTSQAPLGNWNDQRFQNGCEEASVAMAMKWIENEKLSSPAGAQQEIIEIAEFEEETFGTFIDASVEQVGKIFSQYYGHKNFTVVQDVTLENLRAQLAKGHIVLVPAFGRALKNPNYTQPGPITHMLVVVEYDIEKKEFITNDPGTKRGEGYRYDENILFDAIWAYPAGKKHPVPPKTTAEKSMLIVKKNQ